MAISNEELDYEQHIAFYKNNRLLSGDEQNDGYWHQQAEYVHALSICDAIRDVHLEAVSLGQRLTSAEAQLQLHFGVARRTKFIWLALRNLLGAHPSRAHGAAASR